MNSTAAGGWGVMQWLRSRTESGPPTGAERHAALLHTLERDVLLPRFDTLPMMAKPAAAGSPQANDPTPLHARPLLDSTVSTEPNGTTKRRHTFRNSAALDIQRGETVDRAVVELFDDVIQPAAPSRKDSPADPEPRSAGRKALVDRVNQAVQALLLAFVIATSVKAARAAVVREGQSLMIEP